jgi:hypothetical protein
MKVKFAKKNSYIGTLLKFGLCSIPVYSGFGLDRFHCICIYIQYWCIDGKYRIMWRGLETGERSVSC